MRACTINKKTLSHSKVRIALYTYMSFSLEPLCHSFESNIYRPALRFVCAKLNSLPRRYTPSAFGVSHPWELCIENCRHERFRSGINRSGLLITCCNTLARSFSVPGHRYTHRYPIFGSEAFGRYKAAFYAVAYACPECIKQRSMLSRCNIV